MKHSRIKVFLFLLLSVATICSATFITQYCDIKHQIIANPDFSAGLSQWQVKKAVTADITVDNGELSLHSSDPKTSTTVYQVIPNHFTGGKVRLEALVRTNEVIAGEKSYNKARLLLVQSSDGKSKWRRSHTVVMLEGTTDWKNVSRIFTIAENSSELRIVAQMSRCSGEFFLKDLSLYQVEETTLYTWVKWSIRGAWISFIFYLFVPYPGTRRFIISKAPVLFTVAAILIGTTMPAAVKHDILQKMGSGLTGTKNEISTYVSPAKHSISQPEWSRSAVKKIDITKIAHFALFALLVLILRYNNPSRPIRLLMLDVFMLACATELNQLFIDGRSPLLMDLVIDMAGGGAGLLLAWSLSKKILSGSRTSLP